MTRTVWCCLKDEAPDYDCGCIWGNAVAFQGYILNLKSLFCIVWWPSDTRSINDNNSHNNNINCSIGISDAVYFFSFCFVSGSPGDVLLHQMQLAFSELMHLICFIMIVISTSAPTGAAAAVLLPVTALCGVISVRVSRWVYGTQRCRLHYGWHSSLISPLTDDDDQHTAHHRH